MLCHLLVQPKADEAEYLPWYLRAELRMMVAWADAGAAVVGEAVVEK